VNNNIENLVNFERTWRIMVCLNPSHDIVKFRTNKVGSIHCPTCEATMVVEVKFNDFCYDMDDDLNDTNS